jgi:hypothetical protein
MTLQEKLEQIRDLAVSALAELSPLPSPSWSVPLGSLANESGYLQNPALVECTNGDLLCFYRKGTSHYSTGGGQIIMRRSTNRGVSWSAPSVLHQIANKDARGVIAGVDPVSGNVVVQNHSASTSGVIEKDWLHVSSDHGDTWTTRELTELALPDRHGFGPIVSTVNGLCAVYYWFNKIWAIFSTDGGLTWGNRVTVFNQAWTSATLAEPWILALDASRLVIVARDNKDGGRYFYTKSEDGGLTWTEPASARFTTSVLSLAAPCSMCIESGNVVFGWDAREPFFNQYIERVEKEAFWSNPALGWQRQVATPEIAYHSKADAGTATGGEFGYITMLQLPEGTLRVFYDSKTGNGTTETEILVGAL